MDMVVCHPYMKAYFCTLAVCSLPNGVMSEMMVSSQTAHIPTLLGLEF